MHGVLFPLPFSPPFSNERFLLNPVQNLRNRQHFAFYIISFLPDSLKQSLHFSVYICKKNLNTFCPRVGLRHYKLAFVSPAYRDLLGHFACYSCYAAGNQAAWPSLASHPASRNFLPFFSRFESARGTAGPASFFFISPSCNLFLRKGPKPQKISVSIFSIFLSAIS